MIKHLLLILLTFFCTISYSQTVTQVKPKAKKTSTSKRKSKEKSTKGLSDSEKEIMSFSKGKKANQKPKYTKDKNGKWLKVKEVEKIKFKPINAPMYNPIVSNGKTLTGNISSRQGFRICIYNGSNREEAFRIKQEFSKTETKLRSYIVYNRPNYKIKVGDYADKKQATKELKKIIQKYPSSFITPDIVTVKNFEVHTARKSRRVKS